MKKFLLFAVLLVGCGGGSTEPTRTAPVVPPPPPVPAVTSVAVSCQSPAMSGGTSQCTADVKGTGNLAVTWQASNGAIDASGVLTAPAVTAVTVTAASVQNPNVNGTASVTVNPPPAPEVTSIAVSCQSPVVSGGTSQCTADVRGTGNLAVTWGASGGTAISLSGLLTAPTVTTSTNVIVTATSVETLSVSGMATVAVNPPLPSGPVDLSSGLQANQKPVVVVDSQGNIDVGWFEEAITDATFQFAFTRSTDGGATFAPIQLGDTKLGDVAYLQMAVDGQGTVSAMWWEHTLSPSGRVFYSRNGNLVDLGVPNAFQPQLVVAPTGRVSVLFLDETAHTLVLTQSLDGISFSAPTVIESAPSAIGLNAVAGTQDQTYAFWGQENGDGSCQIMLAASLDGTRFPTAVPAENSPGCILNPVAIVEPSGNIDLTWTGAGQVSFAQSKDQGATFLPSQAWNPLPTQTPTGIISSQRLAASQSIVAVVWAVNTDIYAVVSNDDGATFSAQKTLSLPMHSTGSSNPVVAIDTNGVVSVVWTYEASVVEARSMDGGVTFSTQVSLSQPRGQTADVPKLAVDSHGHTYIVWETTNFPSDIWFMVQ